MKIKSTILITILTTLIIGCESKPKGMDRKIDGSSDESAKKSVELLTRELSPDQLKKFTQAYGALAMRWAFSNAFSGEDKGSEEFLKLINGKTPQQIIDLAQSQANDINTNLASDNADKSEENKPTQAHINLPLNIDGIEILITDLRIGELKKVDSKYSFGSVQDGDFLLATVALKNVTEGNIIQIQDVWGDTSVIDEFENVYDKPGALSYSMSSVQGAISSQALKPGESVKDLLILEKPLDNAKKFTLTSDPNFFRRSGNDRLKQISSDSFTLEFTRDDIKLEAQQAAP